MNKTDIQLKQDIDDELRWDPQVNAARIGVSVEQGAVSLQDQVDTFGEKWAAEGAAKRVGGVRTVAQDLTVKVLGDHQRTDLEIAEAALNALRWDVRVPNTVRVEVEQGRITLEGLVDSHFQRDAAEHAMRHLMGVLSVTNSIHIHSSVSPAEVKSKVQAALQRQAAADASTIHVEAAGGTVTLTGTASSWHAIEDAAAAAWAAPGVTAVIDQVHMAGF